VSAPAVGGVSQQVAYTYDAAGNVASVRDPKGNTLVYSYDANGNRIYERDAAGSVQRVRFWFGESEIWYDATGAVTERLLGRALDIEVQGEV